MVWLGRGQTEWQMAVDQPKVIVRLSCSQYVST